MVALRCTVARQATAAPGSAVAPLHRNGRRRAAPAAPHDKARLRTFAVSPRFETGGFDQQNSDVPAAYKREMKNRAVHSASRGGNLVILRELLSDCSVEHVLAFRDKQGSTILHAAAGKGKTLVTNSHFFF